MIRHGREHLVRTREQLAQDIGMPMGTFRNKKPYTAEGFPAPVSSEGARVLLWDGEQTAAYFTSRPVPALPAPGAPGDLLDRQEAAAVLNVAPRSWDTYKSDPRLSPHLVVIGGVEHWPRSVVQAFQDSRPGKQAATGRPKGRPDAVPRGEVYGKVAALLEADPAVTIAAVCAELGVAPATAQRALSQLRREHIELLMGVQPLLTADQAAARLGYPAAVRGRTRSSAVTTTNDTNTDTRRESHA
ncbi:hypothetical protein Slala03_77200 [Streptomyces lavendulae subsp. lavendulae]|uniref:hypothetical protein n=1 Tax=Streptomyces lavendulae TaxID=1914 RepID=UPI0024A5B2D7|nr:hypothetical protein [Streptomyces lavendulae]GLV88031.1 hypothetical protein Slala03_77200 [Streptomyces lavendulae subsp. lavendulae]